MMSKIPPIDVFFMEYLDVDCDFMESVREQLDKCSGFNFGTISDTMIEFARLHVQACKEEIKNKARINRNPTGDGQSSEKEISTSFIGDLGYEDYMPVIYTINKDSILNSYPLDNIK